MTYEILFVMDPLDKIKIHKDSTYAMMLEASQRNWALSYCLMTHLVLQDGNVMAKAQPINITNNKDTWYEHSEPAKLLPAKSFDVIFIRKDPPFDLNYLYVTIFLELAQHDKNIIINNPQSLRDANEKLFISWFPTLCPPTLVTADIALIREFLAKQKHIVVKPLDSMGGKGVFSIKKGDTNFNSIIETLTHNQSLPIMAQTYLPGVKNGDKRILLIDGKAFPYGLSRIPQKDDFRANLATGGKGVGTRLTPQEIQICETIGPVLKSKGLFFVGIDVIDGKLTEINVTSPTCIQEINQAFNVNISADIFDALEARLGSTPLN